MSIFYKPNYLKKKELYSKEDSLVIQVVYYHSKKRVSFSTNVEVKLTDSDDYWNEYDNQLTSNKTDKKELEKVLKSYIEPNIIKKLVRLNKSFNGFEEWCKLYKEKKIKGMDFLIE